MTTQHILGENSKKSEGDHTLRGSEMVYAKPIRWMAANYRRLVVRIVKYIGVKTLSPNESPLPTWAHSQFDLGPDFELS